MEEWKIYAFNCLRQYSAAQPSSCFNQRRSCAAVQCVQHVLTPLHVIPIHVVWLVHVQWLSLDRGILGMCPITWHLLHSCQLMNEDFIQINLYVCTERCTACVSYTMRAGRFNLNDYDYVANSNGYGDETYGDVTDDLDIIVSWTWQNTTYSVGRFVSGSNNGSNAPGVMYGGDNTYYGTQYEIVFFQVGITPPPAKFHVCVAWQFSQTPLMRTVMTVYQGYEVASYGRDVDTYLTSDTFCNPDAAGYIATYDAAAPAQPSPLSPPAAPPQPQPLFPLYFRADWNVLSGVRGALMTHCFCLEACS